MSILLEVQRTIKRVDNWAFYMAFCKLSEHSDIFSDNTGVAHTLKKREVDCISAGHKDADLWMFVWSKVNMGLDEGISISVVWNKAHVTLEEKARKSPQNRQLSWAKRKLTSQPRLEPLRMVLRWLNELLQMPLTFERRCMRGFDAQSPFMMRLRSWFI